MSKQIIRRSIAALLAAVMMVTSVPETVYAVEQAGGTEQENSASVEADINADEKADSEDKTEAETSDEKKDEEESKTAAPDDETNKGDVNDEDISDQDNASGEENESEMPDSEGNREETDEGSLDDTAGEEDLEADDESDLIEEEEIADVRIYNAVRSVIGDDYPYKNSCSGCHQIRNGDSHDDVAYGFFYRQCTSFVAWRLRSQNGVVDFSNNYAGVQWGNAGNWGTAARSAGITVDNTPRVGSVWWSSAGTYGHVAWVAEVNGNQVTIEEYNYNIIGGYGKRILSASSATGYIHIKDIAEETPPQPEIGSDMPAPFTCTIPDGDYHIVTALDGDMCLTIDSVSTENGANADIFHGTEEDFQVWTVTWLGADKGYKIIHRESGKSLDVAGASRENGANVWQWEYYDPPEHTQNWVINEVDQGAYYTIQSRGSGYYLDVTGGAAADKTNVQIYKWVSADNPAQRWRFIPVGTQTIPDGDYYIMTDVADNMCLDVEAGADGDDNAVISGKTGQRSQMYTVSYLDHGFYKILNKDSGKSLDVYLAEAKRGANVCHWSGGYGGGFNQQWAIRESGGSYYIQPRHSGHYLDVANGQTAEGTNVWTTVWMGGASAQKWRFEPVEKPKLAPPTASIPSGSVVAGGTRIFLNGGGADYIYFTWDGSDPRTSPNRYSYDTGFSTSGIPVFNSWETMTIKAYAVKDGYQDSDVAEFTYIVAENMKPEDNEAGDVLEEDIPQGNVENIPEGLWMSAVSSQIYTGKAIKPQVRVYDHITLLTEKKDYTISYKNNVKTNIVSGVNVPTITVTGKGNYTGKEVQTFVIRPKSLSDADIMADDITLQYNGKVQKSLPVLTWNGKKLTRNKDYTVSYPDEESDGVANPTAYLKTETYTVLVKGMGNYTGEKTINLTITQSKPASAMTIAKIANHTYTGAEVRPVPVVKSGKAVLTEGADYEVSYQNNINVGTATVVITGKGSYAGVKKAAFKIVPRASLNKAKADMEFDSPLVYNGRVVRPDRCRLTVSEKNADGRTVTVTLTEGIDYKTSYMNDNKAGTAAVIFQGINGYSGALKKTYKIAPYDIGKDETDLSEAEQQIRIELADSYAYVKGGCKPEPAVTFQGRVLTKGTDYTLSYKNNNGLNDGSNPRKQPIVIVKGKGCFKGTREKTYRITPKEIDRTSMTAADRVWQNKGSIYKTKVVIKDEDGKALNAGKDYDSALTYEYNSDTKLADGTLRHAGEHVAAQDIIPAGTVIRVTAAAKGSNYSGTVSCVYRITKADIGKASVTIPAQTYTGKAVTPENEIRIKLNGKILPEENYQITGYSNNINKGTATVTISGINDCGGTKTAKFKIKGKGFLWWWR